MILKEQNKNKTKLLGTPADNKHKHNAGDERADVIKRACFRERMIYCWEQFIKAYVTFSLKVKKEWVLGRGFLLGFFRFSVSEIRSAAEQPAQPV